VLDFREVSVVRGNSAFDGVVDEIVVADEIAVGAAHKNTVEVEYIWVAVWSRDRHDGDLQGTRHDCRAT
jgi:hypothetical protein